MNLKRERERERERERGGWTGQGIDRKDGAQHFLLEIFVSRHVSFDGSARP